MEQDVLASPYLPRHTAALVRETLSDTPITVIQGARQVGKSTLAKQLASEFRAVVLSLDEPGVLEAASNDPDGFVRQAGDRLLVLDELQRAPGLIRALKAAVDEDRRPGRFLVTGSADLLTLPGNSDSLAGRAETIELGGLSQGELQRSADDFVTHLMADGGGSLAGFTTGWQREDLVAAVVAGGYPDAIARSGRARDRWYGNYLTRIVQRDASEISRLQHSDRLGRLLRLISANNAGELVIAHLARDSGVPASSVEPYLQLLESLYLVRRLPAWGHNLTKRVIGRPKIAVKDSGLAAHLNGMTAESLSTPVGASRLGGLLEGFVGSELRKQQTWSDTRFSVNHFRDRDLAEVDIVIEAASGEVIGIEVKAARSVNRQDFKGLELLRDKLGETFVAGFVLHAGPQVLPFGDRLRSAPVSLLWQHGAG